jgi:hypothetical protein
MRAMNDLLLAPRRNPVPGGWRAIEGTELMYRVEHRTPLLDPRRDWGALLAVLACLGIWAGFVWWVVGLT